MARLEPVELKGEVRYFAEQPDSEELVAEDVEWQEKAAKALASGVFAETEDHRFEMRCCRSKRKNLTTSLMLLVLGIQTWDQNFEMARKVTRILRRLGWEQRGYTEPTSRRSIPDEHYWLPVGAAPKRIKVKPKAGALESGLHAGLNRDII